MTKNLCLDKQCRHEHTLPRFDNETRTHRVACAQCFCLYLLPDELVWRE